MCSFVEHPLPMSIAHCVVVAGMGSRDCRLQVHGANIVFYNVDVTR